MNKLNFLSKFAIAGIVATGGITLITPQEVKAATAYGFSTADVDVTITPAGFVIPGFGTATSDSAIVIDTPGGICSNVNPLDALQCYVGPAPAPAQNFFGQKGKETPDYARSDVLIDAATTTFVSGQNVAETYIAHPISNIGVGDEG